MIITKWYNHEFESSCSTTDEFVKFTRDFKKYIKDAAKPFELVNFSRGHFYISGFVKNTTTGKYIYFGTSDVRFFREEWHTQILIRSAKHEKDYTGGRNGFYTLENFKQAVTELTA